MKICILSISNGHYIIDDFISQKIGIFPTINMTCKIVFNSKLQLEFHVLVISLPFYALSDDLFNHGRLFYFKIFR